jgi:hypothetical protein
MLRLSGLLLIGTLLLAVGGVSASVPQAASSPIVELARYGGDRCFNRCVSGRIFRRCQNDSEAEKENCCNRICNRLDNPYY